VAKEHRAQGLGGILLAHALRKAYESASAVGSCMVVVDAIDEGAASFYAAHGFVRLPESMRLILPMRTIEKFL
jgi:GNAT superfamily N-acetyltransferase